MKYIVCLKNANSPTGVAYLGGSGCNGFDVCHESEAHQFDWHDAERFAHHFIGQYRGFHGGADIVVNPVSI